jgi:hypothetical protein
MIASVAEKGERIRKKRGRQPDRWRCEVSSFRLLFVFFGDLLRCLHSLGVKIKTKTKSERAGKGMI